MTVATLSCEFGQSLGLDSLSVDDAKSESDTSQCPVAHSQTNPILREVDRLEQMISILNQERTRHLHTYNETYSATGELPAEVLSQIFLYSRPPIDFSTRKSPSSMPTKYDDEREYFSEDDFQLTLGAVSHHWRQVVLSTPQLWTSISIKVAQSSIRNVVSLLELYFERAQPFPVTIELDCRTELQDLFKWEYSSEDIRKTMLNIEPLKSSLFIDHAHRVHELTLNGLLPDWVPLINHRLSRCQRVTFCWPENIMPAEDMLPLARLPSLHHVRVISFDFFSLPQGLTDLELEDMPTSVYVEALIECPSLVRFKVYSSPYAKHPDESIPTLTRLIVHEHLQKLEWFDNSASSKWARAFLSQLRFTCLQELSWTGDKATLDLGRNKAEEPALNRLREFFSNLPSSLRALKLSTKREVVYSFLYLKSVFVGLPYLENLHLDSFDAGSAAQVLDMVGHPSAALISGDVWPDPHIIDTTITYGPRLLVEMRTMVVTCDQMFYLEKRLVKMLQSLHASRGTTLAFVMELSRKVEWGVEAVKRLRALREMEFDFVIKTKEELLDLTSLQPDHDEINPLSHLHYSPDYGRHLAGRW